MSIEKNLLPLNMVKSELDTSLLQIIGILEGIVDESYDEVKVNQCTLAFKELKGVFQIILMPECVLLCDLLIESNTAIAIRHDDEKNHRILSKISSSIVALMHYLEYVETRQVSLPELLLLHINELRIILGQRALSESHFFKVELNHIDTAEVKPISETNSSNNRLRYMYQLGLLGIFKEESTISNFKMMSHALMRLSHLYGTQSSAHIFRLFQGVVDSFIFGKVALTTERKLFFGSIDRYIKILLNPDLVSVDQKVTLTLIKKSLYLVALSELNSDLLNQLHEEYQLTAFNLDDAYIMRERELMAGPSSSVIYAVSVAVCEEVLSLKDQLDLLSRKEDYMEGLLELAGDVKKVQYTLTLLGLKESSELLKRLNADMQSIDNPENLDEILDGFANTLLTVEQSIAQLANKNQPLEKTTIVIPEKNLELEEISVCAVKESRKIIAGVQYALSTFVESNFNEKFLEKTIENLHTAWGGLYFLNILRAADQVDKSATYIDQKILGYEKVEDVQKLHTLADVLASIDYYLEGLENKKPLIQGALNIADESLAELGFEFPKIA